MIGRKKLDDAEQATKFSRLSALLGDRRRTVVALSISSIVSGFAEAGMLAVIAEIAASLVNKAQKIHVHLGSLHLSVGVGTLILIAFAFTFVRLLMQIPLAILPARIAADVQAQLRSKLFHAYTRASWDVQSRDREGQLQDTMTSQAMQAAGGALQATGLISNTFNFLALLITAFLLNPAAAAAILVVGVILLGMLRPLRAIGVRRARELSQAQVEYASGIGESIRVAEETQVFGVGEAQRTRIDGLILHSRDLYYGTQVFAKLIPSLAQSVIFIGLVIGLAALHAAGAGHATAIGAIILLLVRSARSGQQGLGSYQSLSQAIPFIERTQEAERRYAESSRPAGNVPLHSVQTLSFDDVSYAYRPDRPVLSGISFEVVRGEAAGIIGPTGAGKSTLIQILLQLRSPQQGQYLVNGVSADQIVPTDWHNRIAYVPQEPRLLHATVAENIRYLRDIDDSAVERAARLAHIHEDIVSWPNGYETVVGPRADAVSGGQQQRLCLARALVARPEVLVLDEPTSALDPRSETLIQESLGGLKHELTLFIIAHRMSTLDICDRVMVIMDGRLVAFDTIDLLRANNSYYRSAAALAGAPGQAP
jgi:ABC-type multidrug transport system fused ATPase/permease subunit